MLSMDGAEFSPRNGTLKYVIQKYKTMRILIRKNKQKYAFKTEKLHCNSSTTSATAMPYEKVVFPKEHFSNCSIV